MARLPRQPKRQRDVTVTAQTSKTVSIAFKPARTKRSLRCPGIEDFFLTTVVHTPALLQYFKRRKGALEPLYTHRYPLQSRLQADTDENGR